MTVDDVDDIFADHLERLVTHPVAHHVLHHFGDTRTMEAGSFTMALIAVIARADPENKGRLAFGFPEYVAAVTLAQGRSDGMDRLRKIAGVPA